jgi:hypothetical protein
MNKLCNKSYLLFRTSTVKVLSCTDSEIITKMIIPPETLAIPVAHTVKVFIIIAYFSVPAHRIFSGH